MAKLSIIISRLQRLIPFGVFFKPRALPSANLFDAVGVSPERAKYISVGQRPMG